MALGLHLASDYGVMETGGLILNNTNGNPVAMMVGSLESGGRLPWNIFGKRVWLAVGLASVRGSIVFGQENVSLSGQQIVTFNPVLAASNSGPITGGNYVSSYATEAQLDAAVPSDAGQDSTAKTNVVISMNAAKHCRSYVLQDYGPMDLPRISVLMRVYQMRHFIDANDPTLTSHSANTALNENMWGTMSTYNQYLSSSIASTRYMLGVARSGMVTTDYARRYAYGTLPCLEIPAE